MAKEKIILEYETYSSIKECSPMIQELFEKAQQAKLKAHAPYSNFQVGAALQIGRAHV